MYIQTELWFRSLKYICVIFFVLKIATRFFLLFLSIRSFLQDFVEIIRLCCVLRIQECPKGNSCYRVCLFSHSVMHCSLPGCTEHGVLQSRILEQVAIYYFKTISGDLPKPVIEPMFLGSPVLADGLFMTSATLEALAAEECHTKF